MNTIPPMTTDVPNQRRLALDYVVTERAVAVRSDWANSVTKRVFDLAGALLLLAPAVAVTALVALVSAIAFRAWPFFLQERVGRYGRTFRVIKVRSLPKSWRSDAGKHELETDQFPRVSHWLRDFHLDEVPQVFNVLAGQMSIVGPRPMIRSVLATLPADVEQVRHEVRPGVTGPWQISDMGSHPLHECSDLDTTYVRGATLRRDLYVIWRTVVGHLGGGAVESRRLVDYFS